jgi:three-Cys-motif partner protein
VPTRYHDLFFDKRTPQSAVKLRVYEAYLKPWAAKLGRTVPGGTVWVVDGFAGRGRYKTGEPGSPEIALQLSRELAAAGTNYRLQCIFGDTRKSHHATLQALGAEYPSGSAMLIETDFWERVDDVIKLVGDSPALVFVDPFGLAGLNFDALARLCRSLRRSDFIINFRSPAAPRLAAKLAESVTMAVGSPDWTVDTVSRVFRDNLERAGGFLPPASLAIRKRFAGSVQSEMILASHHPDAYELWNDQMVLEVERLDVDNLLGESSASRDRNIEQVMERLVRWAPRGRSWQRREAVSWHAVEYCGDAHTGTVKRAHDRAAIQWRLLNPGASVEERRYRWA